MTQRAVLQDDAASPGIERVDLLLRHGQIITMDAERRILLDGTIAVREGRIIAVGPDREVAPRFGAAMVRDLGGGLVHPGFVDAHVHTSTDLIRGFSRKTVPDMTPFDMALLKSNAPEADHLGTLLSCMEMVANGTTTYCDTGSSFFSLDETARAIDAVGMRGIPGYFLFGDVDLSAGTVDPTGVSKSERWLRGDEADLVRLSTEECLRRLGEQLQRYPFRGPQLVRCAVTLYGCGRTSDRLLQEAKALAERHGVPMVIHQQWGPEEAVSSNLAFGRAPIEHLADLGVLGPNLTLVHMIHLTEAEVRLVVESRTNVVHCPGASMRRGMGAIRIGRFPEMVEAGVTVALGSDGHSSKHDLARQAFLAVVGFREVRGDFPVFTAETALEMATLHGARALGMADEVGSLEVGKRADIVVHTTSRPEAHPVLQDPVDNLVFFRQSSTVDTVFVNGKAILDGGRFTRFDAEDAYRRIDEFAAFLEEQIDPRSFAAWPLVP